MGTRIFILFSILVLLVVGCGGDDGVTPEPDPGQPPIVSGTVGTAGGELASDDVVLTVPAGALPADTELDIYDDTESDPFDQAGLPVYVVDGLPTDLGAPVTLRFRHGVTDKDGPGLLMGELRDTRDAGRDLTWEAVACRDSSGWAIVELTRGPYFPGDKYRCNITLAVVQNLVATEPSAHFQVYYLESDFDADRAAVSLAMLEEAYNNLVGLGFDFGAQDTIWPVPAYMVWPEDRVACWVNGSSARGFFQFPPHDTEPNDVLRTIYQHEVCHLAQMWFDTRPPSQWYLLNEQRTWLDEAMASWSEHYFYAAFPWPFSWTSDNAHAPLAGLAGHPSLSADDYGYGMCTFFATLVNEQDVAAVHDIFVQFAQHDMNPVAALQAALDQPYMPWCVDFHQDLYLGQVYDTHSVDFLGDRVPQESLYRDVGNSQTFALQVPDFGSQALEIELAGALNDEEADALRLRAPGGTTISAFVTSAITMPTLITFGTDSLTIGDLDDISATGDGWGRLLVVVTKDWSDVPGWNGHADVNLEVEMLPSHAFAPYTYVGDLRLLTDVSWSDGGGGPQFMLFDPYSDTNGVWTDNEFFATCTHTGEFSSETVSIALIVDPASGDITEFEAEWDYALPELQLTKHYEAAGGPMPLVSNEDDTLTWRITGLAACSSLTHRYQNQWEEGALVRESTGYSCQADGDDQSYIEVTLSIPWVPPARR